MGRHLRLALAPVLVHERLAVDWQTAIRVYRHAEQTGVRLQSKECQNGYTPTIRYNTQPRLWDRAWALFVNSKSIKFLFI